MKFRRAQRLRMLVALAALLTGALLVVPVAIGYYATANLDRVGRVDQWLSLGGLFVAVIAVATALFSTTLTYRKASVEGARQSESGLARELVHKFAALELAAGRILSKAESVSLIRIRSGLQRQGTWTDGDVTAFDDALRVRNRVVHGENNDLDRDSLKAALITVNSLHQKLDIEYARESDAVELSRARARRRLWTSWGAAAVASALMVIYTITLDARSNEEDPATYLDGSVNIGINGELPGWSVKAGQSYKGFDVALAMALADEIGFEPNFVPLRLNERVSALRDGRVDLVISTYSVTIERRNHVGFAGPYFYDRSGIFTSQVKSMSSPDDPLVCTVSGSTASAYVNDLDLRTVTEATLADCLQRFFNLDDRVTGIVTDESIVRAYGASRGALTSLVFFRPIGLEEYGIGIPKNSPRLCRVINDALDEIFNSSWEKIFREELPDLDPQEHKPFKTDPSYCERY